MDMAPGKVFVFFFTKILGAEVLIPVSVVIHSPTFLKEVRPLETMEYRQY